MNELSEWSQISVEMTELIDSFQYRMWRGQARIQDFVVLGQRDRHSSQGWPSRRGAAWVGTCRVCPALCQGGEVQQSGGGLGG